MTFLEQYNDNENVSYNNSTNKIETFLNNLNYNIYKRSWNRLEYKYKKEKVMDYITTNCEKHTIPVVRKEELFIYMDKLIKKTKFNKFFKYDKEICEITSIKFMEFIDGDYIINPY
mgnify:FL=1